MIKIKQTWHTAEVKVLLQGTKEQMVWDYAVQVVDKARGYCPRKYGYLAASIMAKSQQQSTVLGNPSNYARLVAPAGYTVPSFQEIEAPSSNDVNVGTVVRYAPYVEYRQPFLRPALGDTEPEVEEIVKKSVTKTAGKYVYASSGGGLRGLVGYILRKFMKASL